MSYERIINVKGHKYRQLVESCWDTKRKQSRTKVIEHLGPVVEDSNGQLQTSIRIDGVETACQAGHLALYFSIANEFSINTCLSQVCPSKDNKVSNALLALIFNQLNGHKALVKIGPWINKSPLGRWMGIDGTSLTKDILSNGLDAVCYTDEDVITRYNYSIQKFITKYWQAKIGKDRPHYFYYDVARIRYNGSSCPLAERGYGPKDKGRPHVGFGLITSRQNHFPIFSMTIKGSIHDSKTFKGMADRLSVWDLNRLTLIVDRGLFNRKTVAYARKNEFHILGGCTESSEEVGDALRQWQDDDIEKSTQVYLKASGEELYYKGWKGELFGEDGHLVITLDPQRRTRERGRRDRLLYELRKGAKGAKLNTTRKELGQVVVPSVGRRGWRIDDNAETQARKADGRFLLFTTDIKIKAEEVVRAYFQRDEIEKAFRDMNGGASLGPIRYRLSNHVDPYLTVICHLAYLIRVGIKWKLKEAKRPESVDEAIEILREIYDVTLTNKQKHITRWSNLTKKQEQLVKALDLTTLIPRY